MTTAPSGEVGTGVRRALAGLDAWELAGSLLGLRNGLHALAGEVATGTWFPPGGGPPADRWTFPDAVWSDLRRRDPAVAALPLGRVAERALKRAVAGATAGRGTDPRQALAGGDAGAPLLELTIAAFLAELALDLLRRTQTGQRHDSPYRYRFFAGGRVLVPVEEELAWRRRLAVEAELYASLLAPRVESAAGAGDFPGGAAALAWACQDIFGESPEQPPPGIRRGLEVTAAAGAGGTREYDPGGGTLDLRFGPAGNVALLLHPPRLYPSDAPEGCADDPLVLPALARDLLEIGAAVYVADQWVPRRPNLGRRLRLRIAVRRPESWLEVRPVLEEAIAALGRDDVHLSFVAAEGTGESDPEVPAPAEARAVALFSGGLDSLAGAVRELSAEEPPDRLYLVSHYADTRLSGVQKALIRGLAGCWPDRLVHVTAFVGRSRSPERALRSQARPFNPLVQYLRSFLFLATAGAVAVATGSRRINVCENGPLALNPTFTEGRILTQTAHPRLLALFATLLRRLFGDSAPEVDNPFLYATKGEVARVLNTPELRRLALESDSCWTAGAVARTHRGVSHDGTCLPCFIRRAALAAAGIEEADGEGWQGAGRRSGGDGSRHGLGPNRRPGYVCDVLTDFSRAPRSHRVVLADHLRFCATVRELHDAGRWDELLAYCPDLSLDLPGIEPRKLAYTLSRHAGELFAFVESGRGTLRDAFAPESAPDG
jgi:7-cyano-7-deazaguanine synthase in queuosine biosynthesis